MMPQPRSPLAFFVLVAVLSVPFAGVGEATELQLYPGIPVAALAFACPVTAAAILAWREHGWAGASALLGRAFDWRRIRAKAWYVPVVLLMPAVTGLAYGLMDARGLPLRAPLAPALALFPAGPTRPSGSSA